MSLDNLKIRLNEQKRIYDGSSNVTVTYADLSRVIEDLLEILEYKIINGFNKNEKI